MKTPPEDAHVCAAAGCPKWVANNKFARIRAGGGLTGWLFQQDGTNYCPDHLPEWVEPWRKRKGKLK